MTGFPFFKLPLLVQSEVFEQSEPCDLFPLSFSSKRMWTRMAMAITEIHWIDCDIVATGGLRIAVNDLRNRKKFRISVVKKRHESKRILLFQEDREPILLAQSFKSFKEVNDQLVDHVFTMIRRVTHLNYHFDSENELKTDPILKYHRSFYIVTVRGPRRPSARHLSVEDMQLIGSLTITSILKLFPMVSLEYQFHDGFTCNQVYVKYAHWVSMEAIMNSNCAHIGVIWNQAPPAAELRALLIAWINQEKLENLEMFVLDLAYGQFTWAYFDEVFDGIPYEPASSPAEVVIWRIDGQYALFRYTGYAEDNNTQINLFVPDDIDE